MKVLETNRTILRCFSHEDSETVYDLNQDPEVMLFQGGPQTRNRSDFELNEWITHQNRYGYSMWAVIHKESNEFVGTSGLYYFENNEVDLGWRLHKNFWNQGIATELGKALISFGFQNLNLNFLVATSRLNNLVSRHVMQKIGMKYLKDIKYNGVKLAYYHIDRSKDFKH
jgi:RimJ/RimL family protein N-acetyltransferase